MLRPGQQTSDVWWRNGLLYALDVETYLDSDGDGVGDFRGLTDRLDYLAALGVTCLWLLPFFPTPNRDDGYDIIDFYSVDERLGTLGDFVDFRRAAGERGMRVIVDIVFNHTSDQHPWFLSARSSRESPFHDWYIWSDKPVDGAAQEVFPGDQDGIWEWVPDVEQYYLHTFYPFQPDLNFSNPEVREEMYRIIGFWLELGVSGFRIDAAPFLVEEAMEHGDAPRRHHEWFRELHDVVRRRRGDAVMLAEANVSPEELGGFFGEGDEMTMLYAFFMNASVMLGLAREEAAPVAAALRRLPPRPSACGWVQFVRNHDELNLSRLDPDDVEEVLDVFAPDESTRMWKRGIRRGSPPLLGGDRRRIELVYSLMFSLPDLPMLFYGEEIGMGDDLEADGRLAVRTPMQWSSGPNGGFSVAPPEKLVRRLVTADGYGIRDVNVAGQLRDRDSLLRWMQRLIQVRRECREVGFGELRIIDDNGPQVLTLEYSWNRREIITLHNLGGSAAAARVETDLPVREVLLTDGRSRFDPKSGEARLEPYGYLWVRASRKEPLTLEQDGDHRGD